MNKLQQIALTKMRGVGHKTARSLLAHCGTVEHIFDMNEKELLEIPHIKPPAIHAIVSRSYMEDAEKELAFIEKHNIETLWIEDTNYPWRLRQCEDAPLLLYYRGNANLNASRMISVVGTRNATDYGKRLCQELMTELQDLHIQVVSGLAYGIDVQAHRLAVMQGIPTIGVLGHGLDRIYPAAHRDIASRMLAHGGLLTEYPSGTRPDKLNFPARNRIIAGLSDVTIVVEAAQKGGALITAEIANSYNRDVCAFPGGVHQPYSAGCNYLIKTNRAHLIRHADDLLYLLGWDRPAPSVKHQQLQLPIPALTKDEQRVYDILQENDQLHIDVLLELLSWPMSKLAIILLEMEMNNVLISLPGKIYKSL
ncbi:DNA-processing protein DprA [Sphingobacterium suaedae]|uniref:DNA-processing protein DprA n=1 Tax=Sphingobacterium suaedae TaxID=1686402 RepID=A0ABW5KIU5_9SPHI